MNEFRLKKVAEYGRGRLFDSAGVPVLVLHGAWDEMGRQLGRLAGDAIRAAYRANVRAPLFDSGRARYGFAVRTFYSRTWISYPSCVRELFRGVCETSGIPLEQLVFNDQRSSMLSCYADGETGGDESDE